MKDPILLAVVAITILVASCERERHRELYGFLYFGAGSYIGQFDLSDGDGVVVGNVGNATVRHVDRYAETQLLVSTESVVQGKHRNYIVRFDTVSGHSIPILSGHSASFFDDTGQAVYSAGSQLLAKRVKGKLEEHSVLRTFATSVSVVALSDHELLSAATGGPGANIYYHDLSAGVSEPLPALSALCRLDGAVWIANDRSLLCQEANSNLNTPEYIFVSLEGQLLRSMVIPGAVQLRALEYLDGQDAVVLTSVDDGWSRSVPLNVVWAYDLENGTSFKLADDQYLGQSVAFSTR